MESKNKMQSEKVKRVRKERKQSRNVIEKIDNENGERRLERNQRVIGKKGEMESIVKKWRDKY